MTPVVKSQSKGPERVEGHEGLIALDSAASLPKAGDMPTRIVALKWGDNPTAKGNFRVGPKTLAASKLWPQLGFDQVAIDFNHNTVKGSESYKGEPCPIAAMATLSVVEGEGLVFDNIDWRQAGVENRHNYPDLSPAVKDDDSGEVVFCHSLAMCRNGATYGLHLFSAESITADLHEKLTLLMAKETAAAPTHSVKTPTVHKPGTFMINSDLLKQALKLPADATDDDINAALDAFSKTVTGASDNPAVGDTPATDAGALATLTALFKGFGQQLTSLRTELKGEITMLTAERDTEKRNAIVEETLARGAQIPDAWLPDKDGKGGLPLDQLKTLCATLPEIIPLTARTPRHLRDSSMASSGMTPEEREVCRTMGISDEIWKKHNK